MVPQAYVGEGAPDHHLVIRSAGPVGVEVLLLHPLRSQIPSRIGILAEGPGGGDVIGRYGIPQFRKTSGSVDVPDSWFFEDVVEEGRVTYVR
ncbi:hypothetical protein SDC9_188183 [bioreactor metagenome]|uniref:Uncharacterized protein n=1 Tax=bioreactor metagenome TaxID=1076179 RepID=A0A645HNL4_9ZZZZ